MRWEYQVEPIHQGGLATAKNQNLFNILGKEKWELVTVDEGIAYFKRPIQDVPPEQEVEFATTVYVGELGRPLDSTNVLGGKIR